MHYGRNRTLDMGRNSRHKSPRKSRNALEIAFLTKILIMFIKAKLTVSKSYLLVGFVSFMIFFNFLVKKAIFKAFLLFLGDLCREFLPASCARFRP